MNDDPRSRHPIVYGLAILFLIWLFIDTRNAPPKKAPAVKYKWIEKIPEAKE